MNTRWKQDFFFHCYFAKQLVLTDHTKPDGLVETPSHCWSAEFLSACFVDSNMHVRLGLVCVRSKGISAPWGFIFNKSRCTHHWFRREKSKPRKVLFPFCMINNMVSLSYREWFRHQRQNFGKGRIFCAAAWLALDTWAVQLTTFHQSIL